MVTAPEFLIFEILVVFLTVCYKLSYSTVQQEYKINTYTRYIPSFVFSGIRSGGVYRLGVSMRFAELKFSVK